MKKEWKSIGVAVVTFMFLVAFFWGISRIAKAPKVEKEQVKVEQQVKPESSVKDVSLSWSDWFSSRFSYDEALVYHAKKVDSELKKAFAEKNRCEEELEEIEQKKGSNVEISVAATKLSEAEANYAEVKQKVREIPLFYMKWSINSLLNPINFILFLYGMVLLIGIKFIEGKFIVILTIFCSVLVGIMAVTFIILNVMFLNTFCIFTWRNFLLIFLLLIDAYLLANLLANFCLRITYGKS